MEKKALIMLFEGFEEIEVVVPVNILRRAGISITLASLQTALQVKGGRGLNIVAERFMQDLQPEAFDILILPGGPGVSALKGNALLQKWILCFALPNKILAAICAAPVLLAEAGVLKNHKSTSFPGVQKQMQNQVGEYVEDRVVWDEPFLTARGAGVAEEFAFALVEKLCGLTKVKEIKAKILAREV